MNEIIISKRVGISCEFRATLRGPDGKIKVQHPWVKNLVTDIGTGNIRTPNWGLVLHVGTDNTAPNITDTVLGAPVAKNDGSSSYVSSSVEPAPEYERIVTRRFVFNAGTATGTLEELGLSSDQSGPPWTIANTHALFAAPIVKGALDELSVDYKVTLWPDVTDATGVIDISGTNYDYIMRIANCASGPSILFPSVNFYGPSWTSYSGALGAITSQPASSIISASSYSQALGGALGGYYQEATMTWDVDRGNGNEFKCYKGAGNTLGSSQTMGQYQFSLLKVSDSSGIDKVNTHELVIKVRVYVDRT